tara:strand:- start:610 stop:1083 length:474 start_codon:yes stop_codon:yes gene_type:complete
MANTGFWVDGLQGTADRLNAGLLQYTTAASREAAGQTGRLHFATDTNQFSRDNGAGYDNINPVGAAKGYVSIPADGVNEVGLHNVDSVSDTGTGDRTIIWTIDFADANYTNAGLPHQDAESHHRTASVAVGSVRVFIRNNSMTLVDVAHSHVAFGEQ